MGIKGAILGDIAGSRFEFHPKHLGVGAEGLFTDKCSYSDDTIMSIACMMACLNNEDFVNQYVYFGNKYPDAGFGPAFSRWLNPKKEIDQQWLNNHPNEPIVLGRQPYNSWGNGSAMRCSFVGTYLKNNTINEVIDLATKSAEVTHNHPEGIKGAVVTAVCIWMAENGKGKEEILNYAISQYPSSEYQFGVDLPIDTYKDIMRFHVSCQNSVPFAIRCFYETNSLEECLNLVCSIRCDSDTIGAIAGSISESFYGTIPGTDDILQKYLEPELYDLVSKNYFKTKRSVK